MNMKTLLTIILLCSTFLLNGQVRLGGYDKLYDSHNPDGTITKVHLSYDKLIETYNERLSFIIDDWVYILAYEPHEYGYEGRINAYLYKRRLYSHDLWVKACNRVILHHNIGFLKASFDPYLKSSEANGSSYVSSTNLDGVPEIAMFVTILITYEGDPKSTFTQLAYFHSPVKLSDGSYRFDYSECSDLNHYISVNGSEVVTLKGEKVKIFHNVDKSEWILFDDFVSESNDNIIKHGIIGLDKNLTPTWGYIELMEKYE